jgi:sugar phosphate isomerase/epimerase
MYVSLQSTLVAGRVKWPAFAEMAHYVGYPGTDVDVLQAMPEGAEAARGVLSGFGLKPAVINLPVEFRKDEATFRAELPRLEPAVKFAVAIGCPRVATWVPPSSTLPKPEQRRIYKERFQACAEVLRKSGARLGLEFISPLHLRKANPHEFIWGMNEMLEFAKECGPNVGLLLDSWHWHHAGATAADIVKAGKESIVHVQVNDSPKLPAEQIRDNERLMPGEGVIDLVSFFQALKKIGYADGISPEVFGRGLKEMEPVQGASMGLETTTAMMQKAGVA